jgi:flavin reductase (DIM6/NTAB) family NADH-FMN oxidoreductase RutF
MKQSIKNLQTAYRYLYPRLTIIVSSGTINRPNALTIAWSTPLSVDPPLLGVLITKNRFSHEIIKSYEDFVINIPEFSLMEGCFHIGHISGRDEPDKLSRAGFTMEPSNRIKAPRIHECGINLECELHKIIPTGDHDLFIGEVVEIMINPEIIDRWAFDLRKYTPIYWRQSKLKEETFHLKLDSLGE